MDTMIDLLAFLLTVVDVLPSSTAKCWEFFEAYASGYCFEMNDSDQGLALCKGFVLVLVLVLVLVFVLVLVLLL